MRAYSRIGSLVGGQFRRLDRVALHLPRSAGGTRSSSSCPVYARALHSYNYKQHRGGSTRAVGLPCTRRTPAAFDSRLGQARWQGGVSGKPEVPDQKPQTVVTPGTSAGDLLSGKAGRSSGQPQPGGNPEDEDDSVGIMARLATMLRGDPDFARPPKPSVAASLTTAGLSMIGIGILSACHHGVVHSALGGPGTMMLIASMGATAALAYGVPASPFSQPRNIIGGHVFSAMAGVTAYQVVVGLLGLPLWVAAPVAVGGGIFTMEQTGTLHPPSAATGLIAVIGGAGIHDLGYWYAVMPCGVGATCMVAVGLVVNNLRGGAGSYPKYWL